ncbi:TlyA family RNA methyltransferase [Metallococcus carri]|uniref:TlyA family RNA methyltransferase n=1 Tax=Metallococcus carri TaxID=1656884 RepID=UPI002E2BED76|nr:TlyA family RNA methyltransferase [Metallococcus carri]
MTRLDAELVARGLARSRAVAAELIAAGRVSVDGTVVHKAAAKVTSTQRLDVSGEQDPWVGRAAYKLIAALEAFPQVRFDGRRVIDVGASTGGFTQVALHHGATRVEAIDVGHGQLAAEVRSDPRVTDRSGINVRDLDPHEVGGPAPVVVADLSFISLHLVLDRLGALLAEGGDLVILIKPQFEVGKERLGREGVVKSVQQRREVVEAVLADLPTHGLHAHGLAHSPVAGSNGNREYLLWARHEQAGKMGSAQIAEFLSSIERE